MTEKRIRCVKLMTRVTEEEYAQIQARMALVGTGNLSAFLRKLALDGRIVLLDMDEIKTLVSLLRAHQRECEPDCEACQLHEPCVRKRPSGDSKPSRRVMARAG